MDIWKTIVATGCTYELAALPQRSPLPTITTICHRALPQRRTAWLVWAWCGLWALHFFALDHRLLTQTFATIERVTTPHPL